MNSIPFTRNDIVLQLQIQSKALENPADHRQNNQRFHIVQEITKNLKTLHNLPKSIHKIQLKPYLDNKIPILSL